MLFIKVLFYKNLITTIIIFLSLFMTVMSTIYSRRKPAYSPPRTHSKHDINIDIDQELYTEPDNCDYNRNCDLPPDYYVPRFDDLNDMGHHRRHEYLEPRPKIYTWNDPYLNSGPGYSRMMSNSNNPPYVHQNSVRFNPHISPYLGNVPPYPGNEPPYPGYGGMIQPQRFNEHDYMSNYRPIQPQQPTPWGLNNNNNQQFDKHGNPVLFDQYGKPHVMPAKFDRDNTALYKKKVPIIRWFKNLGRRQQNINVNVNSKIFQNDNPPTFYANRPTVHNKRPSFHDNLPPYNPNTGYKSYPPY